MYCRIRRNVGFGVMRGMNFTYSFALFLGKKVCEQFLVSFLTRVLTISGSMLKGVLLKTQ